MKSFYLSRVLRSIVLPYSLAFLVSGIPALAQNAPESPTKPLELAQQDTAAENDKVKKAAKEAQEAIDAAGEAAQEKIDEAVREAEKRLAQTTVVIEKRANWGWLGLLGLIGLFGLGGRGKRVEQTVLHSEEEQQDGTN